jgi:NAD(P)-dependent dehydrogenase (short-subunit alcohol dehydrogenase family)
MSALLHGKVAAITGGASGIGRATAELFVEQGARVVVGDIDETAGRALCDALGTESCFVATDVTSDADMAALVDHAVDRFGSLDVMVNNAGAVGEPSGLLDLDPEGFTATMKLLTGSVLLGHKHAGRVMKAQGGGSIVSLSSIAGLRGGFAAPSYDAAKAAVLQIARSATFELAEYGVRSNVVVPGMTRTPIMARGTQLDPARYGDFVEALREPFAAFHPLRRGGDPADIANAILFFASDMSSFITGQTLVVDGGLTSVFTHDLGAVVGEAFAIMGVTDVDPRFGAAARQT